MKERTRLHKKYLEESREILQKQFNYANPMLIPKLLKIVVSMGIAEAIKDKNIMQVHTKELALLSGQKPIVTKAKKAIANFKLRKDLPIGAMVTLRKRRMFDFLDRFINIISPRHPDFRGFPLKCDGQGNYSLGISDQQIFVELNLDEVKRVQGMNISFVTSAQTDDECRALLTSMGFPFKEIKETI